MHALVLRLAIHAVATPALSVAVALATAQEAPYLGKIVLFGAQEVDGDVPHIMAMNPDGTGLEKLWRDEEGRAILAGRISPDGRQLAFGVHVIGTPGFELWLLDAKRQGTKVSNDAAPAAWSSDGKRLACCRSKEGAFESFILDLESKREEPLPIPPTDIVNDWSPDGTWLSVMAGNRAERFEHPTNGSYPLRRIYRMDIGGKARQNVSGDVMAVAEIRGPERIERAIDELHDDIWSRISPDGRHVNYQQRTHPGTEVLHFTVVQDIAGAGAASAVIMYEDHAEHYEQYKANNVAVWSPDRKLLASPLIAEEKVVKDGETTTRLVCQLLFASPETGFERRLRMNELGIRFIQGIDWR
jgi:hypothetical protein